jgi:hypothetical protein
MVKVSKREQAFKLFDEGKKPSDPDIMALGLSPKTARKYLTMWRKQAGKGEEAPCTKAAEEEAIASVASPAAGEVPVESIPDGNLFEFQGLTYKKRKEVYSGQVIAIRMVGAGYTNILTEKGSAEFKPGVMVIAK